MEHDLVIVDPVKAAVVLAIIGPISRGLIQIARLAVPQLDGW
jgi:hypothetical protein